jgi:hypothetical protein
MRTKISLKNSNIISQNCKILRKKFTSWDRQTVEVFRDRQLSVKVLGQPSPNGRMGTGGCHLNSLNFCL